MSPAISPEISATRLAVDIGGTFTDVVLETPTARFSTKVLTNKTTPELGVLDGITKALVLAKLKPADTWRAAEVESIAIGFLHSYANPAHDWRTAEIVARLLPEMRISLSCDVCPELREYERFSTTCANAYVQPLMARYLEQLRQRLAADGFGCPLLMMTSGGGLTTLETAIRFPIRLVESGPAGGVILSTWTAEQLGINRILSFDMGGTTAKLCLSDDGKPMASRSFEVDRRYRFMKGSGLPIRIPVIEMVEIGAGGGSLAGVDAMKRITVGPESAGSEPGPACYALGSTRPAVTDANVVLGRIDPDRFAGGSVTLH